MKLRLNLSVAGTTTGSFFLAPVSLMTPEAVPVAMFNGADVLASGKLFGNDPRLAWFPDSSLSLEEDLFASSTLLGFGVESRDPKKSLRGDCVLDLSPPVAMLVQNAGLFMNVTCSDCEDRSKVFIYVKIKLFVRRG